MSDHLWWRVNLPPIPAYEVVYLTVLGKGEPLHGRSGGRIKAPHARYPDRRLHRI